MTLVSLLLLIEIGTFVDEPARPVPVLITGKVVDADRKPAAGTGVYFSSLNAGNGWGGVIARMDTDAQGRFRLEVPAAPGGGPKPGILWAYRPGALVASRWVTRETLPPDLPVVMVLDHPAHSEFLVRGPDGRPVAGARIEPRVLNREFFAVPDGLAEQIAARTVANARGRAVLSAFFPEEVGTIFVTAPGLGSQQFGFGHHGGKVEARTIDLRPVGRIEGRIVSDDAAVMRDNRKLSVIVWDQKLGPPALGLLYLTTDPQGRFAIPEVPVGGLSVNGVSLPGSPWYLQSTAGLKVEAGRTTRVEVRPIKGIRSKGVVRERGTGLPIAGVGVGVLRPGAGEDDSVRTDADGRYELFAPPGQPQLSVRSVPEGFAKSHHAVEAPKIPEGALAAAVSPIELSRAGNVRGVVVDDRGEPVAGATVLAFWRIDEGPNRSGIQETRATTGRRGEFLIERAVAEFPAKLSAIAPDGRRTAHLVSARAGGKPLTLSLGISTSVSLAGRVVDARGHRVAGACVRLRVQTRDPSGQVEGDKLVEIRDAYVIQTKDDGWFRTPTVLDPELEYAAIAEADGFESAWTSWTAGKARTFPELVLQPKASDRPAVEARVLESLPDDPDIAFNPSKNPKNNARRWLAALLAGPPAKRWETFTHRLLYLWIVGEENIF